MVQMLPKEENGTILKEMCEASCQSLVLFPDIELWCSETSLYWGALYMCSCSEKYLTQVFDHLEHFL